MYGKQIIGCMIAGIAAQLLKALWNYCEPRPMARMIFKGCASAFAVYIGWGICEAVKFQWPMCLFSAVVFIPCLYFLNVREWNEWRYGSDS